MWRRLPRRSLLSAAVSYPSLVVQRISEIVWVVLTWAAYPSPFIFEITFRMTRGKDGCQIKENTILKKVAESKDVVETDSAEVAGDLTLVASEILEVIDQSGPSNRKNWRSRTLRF